MNPDFTWPSRFTSSFSISFSKLTSLFLAPSELYISKCWSVCLSVCLSVPKLNNLAIFWDKDTKFSTESLKNILKIDFEKKLIFSSIGALYIQMLVGLSVGLSVGTQVE